jgi:hypothetical protein
MANLLGLQLCLLLPSTYLLMYLVVSLWFSHISVEPNSCINLQKFLLDRPVLKVAGNTCPLAICKSNIPYISSYKYLTYEYTTLNTNLLTQRFYALLIAPTCSGLSSWPSSGTPQVLLRRVHLMRVSASISSSTCSITRRFSYNIQG